MKKFKKGDKAVIISGGTGNYAKTLKTKGEKFEIVEITSIRSGIVSVKTESGYVKFSFDIESRSSNGTYNLTDRYSNEGVGLYPYSVEEYKLNKIRNEIAKRIREELIVIENHTVSSLDKVLYILENGE